LHDEVSLAISDGSYPDPSQTASRHVAQRDPAYAVADTEANLEDIGQFAPRD
jgi:hypothetical protein